MKGDNVIEAYCDICRKPVTRAQLDAGMAIIDVRESTVGTARREYHVHIYHLQEAQKILKDENYMKAIGTFVDEMEKKKDKKSDIPPMEIARQIAKDEGLDFKYLELGIKAFYSYATVELRGRKKNDKERQDGDSSGISSDNISDMHNKV